MLEQSWTEPGGDAIGRLEMTVREGLFVQLGELSSGRQALERDDVALGTERTLNMLRDPRKRPTNVQGTSCREASQNSFLSFHLIWTRRGS